MGGAGAEQLLFTGVAASSLGDMLKAYGIISVIGERWPQARFWWDRDFHLAAANVDADPATVEAYICQELPRWAEEVGGAFLRGRKASCSKNPCPHHKCVKKLSGGACCKNARPCPTHQAGKLTCGFAKQAGEDSVLKSGTAQDALNPCLAKLARAASIARRDGTAKNAEPHPWFPGYGQEASGNYFNKLKEYAKKAKKNTAAQDLKRCLFADASAPVKAVADNGYLFFPAAMKRYATGITRWDETASTLSVWDFLLAIRGALLFRGASRRPRWRQASYPAFPFVFDGGGLSELYLPTWGPQHPRTLIELQAQLTQFQVPLGHGSVTATAGEFRAAVQRRGVGTGFTAFHRYDLEERRPGQQQMLLQAIPRGVTYVGGIAQSIDLPAMIERLASSGWSDQFVLARRRGLEEQRSDLLDRRRKVEDAIHRAIDEPRLDSYVGILEAAWEVNRDLVLPGKTSRAFERLRRARRPLPPLPVAPWERALSDGFKDHAEWRIARAIASIVGRFENGTEIGPILQELLPVVYDHSRRTWRPSESDRPEWTGREPLRDFQAILWQRWRRSARLAELPLAGARCAPLCDVARLLRGNIDVGEIHRLVPLLAQLDWQRETARMQEGDHPVARPPILPAYAAIRLWISLGATVPASGQRPLGGEIPRLVSFGTREHVKTAVSLSLRRLRISGLPSMNDGAPFGKAVASFQPQITAEEATRMALAVLIPISRGDTLALSRRLFVAASLEEATV